MGDPGIGGKHFAITETGIRMDSTRETSFRPTTSGPLWKAQRGCPPSPSLLAEYMTTRGGASTVRPRYVIKVLPGRGINLNIATTLWYVNEDRRGGKSDIFFDSFRLPFFPYLSFRPVLCSSSSVHYFWLSLSLWSNPRSFSHSEFSFSRLAVPLLSFFFHPSEWNLRVWHDLYFQPAPGSTCAREYANALSFLHLSRKKKTFVSIPVAAIVLLLLFFSFFLHCNFFRTFFKLLVILIDTLYISHLWSLQKKLTNDIIFI